MVSLLEFVKPWGQVAQHVQALSLQGAMKRHQICARSPPHSCFVNKHSGSDLEVILGLPDNRLIWKPEWLFTTLLKR